MTQALKELDRIQRDTEQVQELARRYQTARNAREARGISREMAKLSKELEAARRAIEDSNGAEAAAM
jgi:ribosome-binding protein aMBF1 (putative translation factor)